MGSAISHRVFWRKMFANLILLTQLHWSSSVVGRKGRGSEEEGKGGGGGGKTYTQSLRKLTKHRVFLKTLFKIINQQHKSHSKRRATHWVEEAIKVDSQTTLLSLHNYYCTTQKRIQG